jgi:hypothetical protein
MRLGGRGFSARWGYEWRAQDKERDYADHHKRESRWMADRMQQVQATAEKNHDAETRYGS